MTERPGNRTWQLLFAALALLFAVWLGFIRFRPTREIPLAAGEPDNSDQQDSSPGSKRLPDPSFREPREDVGRVPQQKPGEQDESVFLPDIWKAEDAIPFEYLVRFYSAADAEAFAALARQKGARVLGSLAAFHAVRVRVENVEQLRALLREGPIGLEQGPNFFVRIPTQPANPLEPYPGGYVGFGPHAPAWLGIPQEHARWGEGITVAILDDGVGRHSALASARIVRLDMLSEATDSSVPAGTHATAVCSLVSGTGSGIGGVSPAATVLSLRVVSQDGVGDAFTTASALVEAVNRGAKVVNICLGGRGDCFVLREAVQYAVERGVVIVAAAGNDGIEGVAYPARYDGVVAVGAVDATGRHLFFSNRGPEIDLVAPGLGVLAAGSDDALISFSGTSAAVPFVTGAVAALLAQEPQLTGLEAVQVLQEWADDTGAPGKDEMTGYGILNIGRVLRRKTPGICDAAMALPYVMPAEEGDELRTVVVYGQNRGTMPLSAVEVVVGLGGEQYAKKFYDIAVGATFALDLTVPAVRLSRPGGLPFECVVRTLAVADQTPENNSIAGVLLPAPR